MSAEHPEDPTGGHEFHLPGPSYWPITMAVGIACLLTGLVLSLYMVIFGAIVSIASAALWIRDARRELRNLPD